LISRFDVNSPRNARWIALVLFLLMLITRLPLQSQYLYHWDSVNMAFGIQNYDVTQGAPQYPGYIVYIVLAQVFNTVFRDHQQTMVIISIVSSGLAASTIFYLGRQMFSSTTGILSALFLISSPLFWFYGEIALPHTLDLFAITLSALLLYKIMLGETRWLWWTVIFLALVGGFRQQDLLFLAPLILFTCYRIGIWRIVGAVILGGLVTAAWLIPLLAYSGGLQSYLAGSSGFTASFFTTTSVLSGAGEFGLRRNILNKLLPYTLYGWSLPAIPAVLYFVLHVPTKWKNWLKSRKVWFLFLWVTPAIVFYAFIHMGQQGLVFVFLPALLIMSAESLYRLLHQRAIAFRLVTAAIVLFGGIVFVLGPTYPLGSDSFKLLTYSTLRDNDRLLRDQIEVIRENFPPDNTLLVSANWRFIQYYLPEYKYAAFNIGARFEVAEGQVTGADYINQPVSTAELGLNGEAGWQIVIADREIDAFVSTAKEQIILDDGFTMSYILAQPDEVYWTDGSSIETR